MINRHSPRRVNVITHIHTEASNGAASVLDARITAVLRQTLGQDTGMSWAECFTPVQRLSQLLAAPSQGRGPVQMVLVTDHMRACSHHFPDGHLRQAAADHRLALGAELATRTRDVDGCYRQGPEILAYGAPGLVPGPHGPRHGLDARLLEELYDSCLDDQGQELCTRRARDLLRRRGVAHALSHPLDGHPLSLEGTLAVISEFDFVESVNGGYFAHSAQLLNAYILLNNAILRGASLPPRLMTPLARRVVAHVRHHGRLICPWGGSDSHYSDFDRVVVSMAVGAGQRTSDLRPSDLFSAMVSGRAAGTGEAPLFVTLGQPATPSSQLADIVGIITRNILNGAPHHRWNPRRVGHLMGLAAVVTRDELGKRRRWRRQRGDDLRQQFDPVALVQALQLPDSEQQPVARRRLRWRFAS